MARVLQVLTQLGRDWAKALMPVLREPWRRWEHWRLRRRIAANEQLLAQIQGVPGLDHSAMFLRALLAFQREQFMLSALQDLEPLRSSEPPADVAKRPA